MKSLTNNECTVPPCGDYTTPEGYFCRKHWDLCPGQFKTELVNTRLAALNAVQFLADLKENKR